MCGSHCGTDWVHAHRASGARVGENFLPGNYIRVSGITVTITEDLMMVTSMGIAFQFGVVSLLPVK